MQASHSASVIDVPRWVSDNEREPEPHCSWESVRNTYLVSRDAEPHVRRSGARTLTLTLELVSGWLLNTSYWAGQFATRTRHREKPIQEEDSRSLASNRSTTQQPPTCGP